MARRLRVHALVHPSSFRTTSFHPANFFARILASTPKVIREVSPDTACLVTATALDPGATEKIENLMRDLAGTYTIVVVTHNMAQARRVTDECIFMLLGDLIEHRRTEDLFIRPRDQRTADYLEGRFG